MIFETSDKNNLRTSIPPTGRPAQQPARPMQQIRRTEQQASKLFRQPAGVKQPVTGWPSQQAVAKRPRPSTISGIPKAQPQKIYTRQAAAKAVQRPVNGWGYRKAVRKPVLSGVSGSPKTGVAYKRQVTTKPGQKPVSGWNYFRQGIRKSQTGTTTVPVRPQRRYTPAMQGTTPRRPSGYYRGAGQMAQPGAQACSCAQGAPKSPAAVMGTRPVQTLPATRGCITLSRFAFNSAQLKPTHKSQIRELALRILEQKINAVIATGHTDSSGTEDYNEELGARRASNVIRELRKQLASLKPNAHRDLFWRINSKGETRPITASDPAANRRVHICVRRAKF